MLYRGEKKKDITSNKKKESETGRKELLACMYNRCDAIIAQSLLNQRCAADMILKLLLTLLDQTDRKRRRRGHAGRPDDRRASCCRCVACDECRRRAEYRRESNVPTNCRGRCTACSSATADPRSPDVARYSHFETPTRGHHDQRGQTKAPMHRDLPSRLL